MMNASVTLGGGESAVTVWRWGRSLEPAVACRGVIPLFGILNMVSHRDLCRPSYLAGQLPERPRVLP
jgi:hypothetical protein